MEFMSYDVTIRFAASFMHAALGRQLLVSMALSLAGEDAPNAITCYRKETVRLVAEMTLGAGALAAIGGTVGVAGLLTLASGAIAVQVVRRWATRYRGVDRSVMFLNVRVVALRSGTGRWCHHRWCHRAASGDEKSQPHSLCLVVTVGRES